jgi:hypothetical protein
VTSEDLSGPNEFNPVENIRNEEIEIALLREKQRRAQP